MDKKIPTICIAGTHSGCGKTTVSLGIMAALVKRGKKVQPFKVGPDFIDPGHHKRITGRDSHNLDSWMMDRNQNQDIFSRYTRDVDIAVVEGVMGLFDGFSGDDESGSTAQMAKWLNLPVILVIDTRSMARSAAAIATGFSGFDRDLPLSGIIFNRVGSSRHARMLEEAMAIFPHIPVLGSLPRDDALEIPSRHLGLITDEDFGLDINQTERLACWIETNLQLDRLLESKIQVGKRPTSPQSSHAVRIGLARDEAFCFYYPENLRLLMEAGAELVNFSPLHDRHLPEGIKGLYFGGGYPELHCRKLSENSEMLDAIRDFGLNGRPIYGECGGFMFFMKEIIDLEGDAYTMAGIFHLTAQMEKRLNTLGYREIRTGKESILGPPGTIIRGHEFHYSRLHEAVPMPETIYTMTDRRSDSKGKEGFLYNHALGSYVHLHWGSNPDVATHFVNYCQKYG